MGNVELIRLSLEGRMFYKDDVMVDMFEFLIDLSNVLTEHSIGQSTCIEHVDYGSGDEDVDILKCTEEELRKHKGEVKVLYNKSMYVYLEFQLTSSFDGDSFVVRQVDETKREEIQEILEFSDVRNMGQDLIGTIYLGDNDCFLKTRLKSEIRQDIHNYFRDNRFPTESINKVVVGQEFHDGDLYGNLIQIDTTVTLNNKSIVVLKLFIIKEKEDRRKVVGYDIVGLR